MVHKNRSGGADLYGFLQIIGRPARMEQTVLYLFCYIIGTSETVFKKKWFLRSRFVQVVIDLWLHSPSKTNSFARVFVYQCESKEASLIEIGPALSIPQIFKNTCFCNVLTIFSSIFITVYGLGGASADLGSLEGKDAADFCTRFQRFFCRY